MNEDGFAAYEKGDYNTALQEFRIATELMTPDQITEAQELTQKWFMEHGK